MSDNIVTASEGPGAVSLRSLLANYRETWRDLGPVLKEIDERDMAGEMEPSAHVAAVEAAHAPNDAARDALIEASVVTLHDIALKLRFYFEVGGDPKMFDTPPDWGSEIVKNVLRDIDRMVGTKIEA